MQLHKTDLARAALDARAADISVRDRRILILSDGQRSMDDIAALLGADARDAVLRLVQDGYLRASAPAAVGGRGLLGGLEAARTARMPASADRGAPVVAVAAPSPATVATPTASAPEPARSSTRRSLAATKMYILDMLQLQRDPDAIALRSRIQASVGQDAILAVVVDAVAHLQRVSNESYGRRVFERVAETIPEEALQELRARCEPAVAGAAA